MFCNEHIHIQCPCKPGHGLAQDTIADDPQLQIMQFPDGLVVHTELPAFAPLTLPDPVRISRLGRYQVQYQRDDMLCD